MVDSEFIFDTVCPIVGVVLSSFQYSSSIKLILEARRLQDIGSINPNPLAVSFIVCVLYLIYGVMLLNTYYVLSILVGLLEGLFACTTVFSLLGHHGRLNAAAAMEKIFLSTFTFISLLGLLFTAGVFSFNTTLEIVGLTCMISVFVYYLAPLANIISMIRRKDSSSLYYPTIVVGLMSCTVWGAYGLSYGDPNLYVPSLVGFALSMAQFAVKTCYLGKNPPVNEPGSDYFAESTSLSGSMHSDHVRSRKLSFDGRPAAMQHIKLGDENNTTIANSTTDIDFDAGRNQRSGTMLSGRSRTNTVTSVLSRACTEAELPDDSGFVLTAISGLLSPFAPQLPMSAIIAAEETPSALKLPYRNEPVTFLGVVTDIIASIPALMIDGTTIASSGFGSSAVSNLSGGVQMAPLSTDDYNNGMSDVMSILGGNNLTTVESVPETEGEEDDEYPFYAS